MLLLLLPSHYVTTTWPFDHEKKGEDGDEQQQKTHTNHLWIIIV